MKAQTVNGVKLRTFESIIDFEDFINKTPLNSVFRWEELESTTKRWGAWSGTESYEEAVDLLKHGADDVSKKLEKALSLDSKTVGERTRQKSYYDVCGFQASVPRYLQGIPTSMVNSKKVPQKEKVVTLNKDVSYSSSWEPEEIIEHSAKALAIVKKLELMGYRVNVNICWRVSEFGEKIGCKIRIKNANERLNISKMAFLVAHPSMLRRILFRFLEVNPDVTNSNFTCGYGKPSSIHDIAEKGEYTLPKEIGSIDAVISLMKLS